MTRLETSATGGTMQPSTNSKFAQNASKTSTLATTFLHKMSVAHWRWEKILQTTEACRPPIMPTSHGWQSKTLKKSNLFQAWITRMISFSSYLLPRYAQWNVPQGFVLVVKTSADKMVLQILDIFSHDFSLFSTQLTLFRPQNSIGLKKGWIHVRKCQKFAKSSCRLIFSQRNKTLGKTFHCGMVSFEIHGEFSKI